VSSGASLETAQAIVAAARLEGQWISPDHLNTQASQKGAYVLLIGLDRALPVGAGRHKSGQLPAGTYFYAGSAYGAGGIAARIGRHFRKDKKVYWHVDRLTLEASRLAAFIVENGNECALAEALLQSNSVAIALEGFGSTDCSSCRSHLLAIV
jgi:Uri superfamily endonuclease